MLARDRGWCSTATVQRVVSCLHLYALPTAIPESMAPCDIVRSMALDKKNVAQRCRLVIITGVGSVRRHPPTSEIGNDAILQVMSSQVVLDPVDEICGTIQVPGSKSLSNRALCMAALSPDSTMISRMLFAEDTLIMISGLRSLGVCITIDINDNVFVKGCGGCFKSPVKPLFLSNAGTAVRFLTSLASLLPEGDSAVLEGSSRMHQRPIGDLVDGLSQGGVRIEYLGKSGCLPIRVHGGGFSGGRITLSASISSQFVSSLMIIAPMGRLDTELILTGDQVQCVVLLQCCHPILRLDCESSLHYHDVKIDGQVFSGRYVIFHASLRYDRNRSRCRVYFFVSVSNRLRCTHMLPLGASYFSNTSVQSRTLVPISSASLPIKVIERMERSKSKAMPHLQHTL